MIAPLVALLVTLGFMAAIWLASVRLRNASIVDIFWGAGFVVGAWVYLALAGGESVRGWLIVSLVTLWGLRLSIHLFVRNHGKGEDYRYREMRERHGARFWWVSFFTVYLLQGVIMWFVGLPLWVATRTPPTQVDSGLAQVDGLGIAIYRICCFFRSVLRTG